MAKININSFRDGYIIGHTDNHTNNDIPMLLIGMNAPPRDYSIHGTTAGKIFSIIGASSNLMFAFNTGMVPEIQVGL